MLEFITDHADCFQAFVSNPAYVGLTLLSLAAAFAVFFKFRDEVRSLKRKVVFAYAHLAFLVFPVMLFLYTMVCTSPAVGCSNMGWLDAAGIIIPSTLAASLVAGLVALPFLFAASSKSRRHTGSEAQWLDETARRLGIRSPRLYLLDDARPQAFSFSSVFSAVFVSVGAFDLLSRKEREAVLLHELGHLKSGSSSLKFSALLLRLATPLAARSFHDALSAEEEKADDFAAAAQGTRRHLQSARKKFESFNA